MPGMVSIDHVSSEDAPVPAPTSTTIPWCCRPASNLRTIRCSAPAPRPTRARSRCAPARAGKAAERGHPSEVQAGQDVTRIRRVSPLVSRLLHWLMAAMVLAMLFIGIGMAPRYPRATGLLIAIHRPLGIAILMLAAIRLANRLLNPPPPLPTPLPPWQRLAAKASHVLLLRTDVHHAAGRLGHALGGALPDGHAMARCTCRPFCRRIRCCTPRLRAYTPVSPIYCSRPSSRTSARRCCTA